MVLNSFSHVFESDAVVKLLCPLANLFGRCFCLDSGPFCVSGLLFLLTKRKSGWRICGSSGWFVGCLVCCDLPAFPDRFGPCTNWRFTAYAHVRTEPQCDIGHTRGKKIQSLHLQAMMGCLHKVWLALRWAGSLWVKLPQRILFRLSTKTKTSSQKICRFAQPLLGREGWPAQGPIDCWLAQLNSSCGQTCRRSCGGKSIE